MANPSFKQILPEHFYINSSGYGKNKEWANGSIKIVEEAKKKIMASNNFDAVLNLVAWGYNKLFNDSEFGILRPNVWGTHINGRYNKYKSRLIQLVETQGTKYFNIRNFQTGKHYSSTVNLSGENVALNEIEVVKAKGLDYLLSGHDVAIVSPVVPAIKKVFDGIVPIYTKIMKNKKPLTDDNIKKIAQDVAKIHWLLSQVRPYKRGSAGIADIIAKSLFESKGIQVTPYKKGVNPNMEAFVMSMEQYTAEYEKFFSKPLRPIENNHK